MNINELTISEAKKIHKELNRMFSAGGVPLEVPGADILAHMVGKKVLIRDNMAGIFITTLENIHGKGWVGGLSRKVFWWERAGAIEGIAVTGLDLEKSKLTIQTTSSAGKDLVQLCPVTDAIYNELMGAKVWNPK
jgi:hypothetical protein